MPKAKLQDLIDAHDQPFVVIDAQYRIVAANRRYQLRYGVDALDIVNRRCHEVSHHCDQPCHEVGEACPHLALFRDGVEVEVLHTHYHGDGQTERTRIRGYAIRGENGEVYLGEILYPLEVDVDLGCEAMRMVGHSPAFLACIDNLARVADCDASVLLNGESGVGKELAARFVHDRSARANGPFIAVNCAAMPESMFETELFGHEKGAFTGSAGLKKGLFEMAHDGTLFLDEVAEIPLTLQAKLLRVLETGEYRRIGGTQTLRADVRLVSASNRDLAGLVDQATFRQDLYYRLAGIEIVLPPLRARSEDIPALAEVLLARMAKAGAIPCRLDRGAAQALKRHDFPGNVRELRNILQRASLRARNGVIHAGDLELATPRPRTVSGPAPEATLPEGAGATRMDDIEKQLIQELLARHNGHRKTVAAILGVTERTLYRKLSKHGLT